MPHITVKLLDPPPDQHAVLVVPRPFEHWEQHFNEFNFTGLEAPVEVKAENSNQRAYVLKPTGTEEPIISYALSKSEHVPSDWVWDVQQNRHTTASPELVGLAQELAGAAHGNPESKIRMLINYAAEMFGYDHVEDGFNAGQETVPAICGTIKGSCVDMNTFILAGALSLGLRGQYIAGYWFHPDKTETHDMHCWLVFDADGKPLFWDLAHHLKWGVSKLEPGLNPAGGRRVAMSCGRGLKFTTPNGNIEISHFAEPIWVMPNGVLLEPAIKVHIDRVF
jgi:hypothetical protein